MDVFLDSAGGKVADAVHIVSAERTLPAQPEPNARIDESEDAGDFRLSSLEALVRMKLSAFRDKDRVHLRDLVSVGHKCVAADAFPSGIACPARNYFVFARRITPDYFTGAKSTHTGVPTSAD